MKENNNEEKAYRSVEKKVIIYPDGKHEVKITMNIKDIRATNVIKTIIKQLQELHKIKNIGELITLKYYYSGIVAGLRAMKAIDKLQAEELIQLIEITVHQQINT